MVWSCLRAPTRNKKFIVVVRVLLILLILTTTLLAINVVQFARSISAHTVSVRDLSHEYQVALNASLLTVPCCKAANWTPTPEEVLAERIPRIIHQTYKTTVLPEGDWKTANGLCHNLHRSTESWHHILWTDETAEKFIAHQYPDFLPTYKQYPFAIQRVDAMRYFVLHHYGGIYLDLDVGCARSMESLLQFPAFFPKTQPLGVSNDLIGCRKGHPLMLELGNALKAQGGRVRYGTKYMTVFFSTGPMFVNRVLAKYWRTPRDDPDKVMILPPNFYSESFSAYFMHFPGSSWHGSDAHGVMLVYYYGWIVLFMFGLYFLCRKLWLKRRKKDRLAQVPYGLLDDYEMANNLNRKA